jgi:hypothetical protein
MPTPVPDRHQLTLNPCPPRWSALKTRLGGLASEGVVDSGTNRTLTAVPASLARRSVPSRRRGTVATGSDAVPRCHPCRPPENSGMTLGCN